MDRFTAVSSTTTIRVRLEFAPDDNSRDFKTASHYAGVQRTFRPLTVILSYVDDLEPHWELVAGQVRNGGALAAMKPQTFTWLSWRKAEPYSVWLDSLGRLYDPRAIAGSLRLARAKEAADAALDA